jgi:hypothetical protein
MKRRQLPEINMGGLDKRFYVLYNHFKARLKPYQCIFNHDDYVQYPSFLVPVFNKQTYRLCSFGMIIDTEQLGSTGLCVSNNPNRQVFNLG